jgi:hypothetical protein
MTAIKGTVRNGQVVLDDPAGLPDGTRVEVVPAEAGRPSVGLREEDWPTTPEGITALLKRMEEIESLEMNAEEEADLADWRKKRKEHELANWEQRSRRIEEVFE